MQRLAEALADMKDRVKEKDHLSNSLTTQLEEMKTQIVGLEDERNSKEKELQNVQQQLDAQIQGLHHELQRKNAEVGDYHSMIVSRKDFKTSMCTKAFIFLPSTKS